MARFATACVASLALTCTAAFADDADGGRPAAVPYRPSVSTPADLTSPGWLEAEVGGLFLDDRHPDADPPRRSSVPYSLKLAFDENWGVRIGGEAVVRQTDVDGVRTTGGGDTALVLKRRFALDDDHAFGLEFGVNAPTARRGLGTGSGKTDYAVNGIYSANYGAWHMDSNLVGTRLGADDADEGRWQTLGALAFSHPVTDRVSLTGEVSATRQSHAPSTAQVLGALAFTPRRDLVLDLGAAHSLNRATPTWQVFAGMTVVVARLF